MAISTNSWKRICGSRSEERNEENISNPFHTREPVGTAALSDPDYLGDLYSGYFTNLDLSGILDVPIAAFRYCGDCHLCWTVQKRADFGATCRQCLHYVLVTACSGQCYADILAPNSYDHHNDDDLATDFDS